MCIFSCKFPHKMALLTCPCAFFPVDFHTKCLFWHVHVDFACSWDLICVLLCSLICVLSYLRSPGLFYVSSPLCSHMCALLCLLLYVCFLLCALLYFFSCMCSHMCTFICVRQFVWFPMSASICALSDISALLCSHMSAPLCSHLNNIVIIIPTTNLISSVLSSNE